MNEAESRIPISVGDVIIYRSWLGPRRVLVTQCNLPFDGQAGFLGMAEDESPRWGLHAQVTENQGPLRREPLRGR